MNVLSRGLTAAACALGLLGAAAPSALAETPPAPNPQVTHTVRVEGSSRTLLPSTQVTTPSYGFVPNAHSDCKYQTPAGPLDAATIGNWDKSNFVKTILGEFHDTITTSWFVWVNGKYGNGICFTELQPGSEILFTAGPIDKNYNPVDLPLVVRDVPRTVAPGTPFTVNVGEVQPDTAPEGYYLGGTGTLKPAAGATVTAGGATATVGADGKATLTVATAGPVTVQAARGTGAARSKPVPTCATNGKDAACGTVAPAAPVVKDTVAPKSAIASLAATKRISAAKAPKLLKGTVTDAGGIASVKLRLTRTSGRTCSAFSAKRERFVRRPKCGAKHGWWWSVGDKAAWEYQLPTKLPKGRYVLDVKATDRSGNRDEERRPGENRVVFEVR